MEDTYGSRVGHDVRPAPQEPAGSPPAAARLLLDRAFGRDEIAVVRHEVTSRLSGYVLAVNEIITNVVLHAGGYGRIALRQVPGAVWCTVTDSGPGIPEEYRDPPAVPEAFEVGGRGIWLAHQLCDEVTIASGPIGTTIGLRLATGTSGLVGGGCPGT